MQILQAHLYVFEYTHFSRGHYTTHGTLSTSVSGTQITWFPSVSPLSLLPRGSISAVPPVPPRLAVGAVSSGRAGDPGVAGAQAGWDLVVL